MPPRTYQRSLRPVPFWFWLSEPNAQKLRPALAELRAQGAGGICLQPFPRGFRDEEFHSQMVSGFATEEFFRRAADLAQLAFEAGLDCWLYDEGGWPSGTAGGQIVSAYPELAARVLRCYPGRAATDSTVVIHSSEQCHYRLEPRLDRTDVFNPQTVQRLIEMVHEGYRRRLKGEFGKRVPGIITSEPSVAGEVGSDSIPWVPEIERLFRRRKGYPLPPRLSCLFAAEVTGGAQGRFTAEEIGRTRRDFLDVLSIRFRDGYFRPLEAWCQQNKLLLAGHLHGDHSLETQAFGGAIHPLRHLRYFDLPGVDLAQGQRGSEDPARQTDFPRLAASAAAFRGNRDACSKLFHGYGWGLVPEDMLRTSGFQLVRGITQFFPSGVSSDTVGPHVYAGVADLGIANPLHPFMGLWADTVARTVEAVRALPRDLRVGVYQPLPEVWQGQDVADPFEATCRELAHGLIDFNTWDDDCIVDAEVHRGRLVLGLARCQYLVFPAQVELSERAIERLRYFLEEGGRIFCPHGVPPELANREGVDTQPDQLSDRLRRLLDPQLEWQPGSEQLYGARLGTPTEASVILYNQGREPATARLHLPGGADTTYHVLDPETGGTYAPNREGTGPAALMTVRVPPGTLRLILRGTTKTQLIPAADYPLGQALTRVTEGWRVSGVYRHDVLPEGVRRREIKERFTTVSLGDWTRQGLPHHSGTLAYEVDFMIPERTNPDAPLFLDLGEVRHAARVWLNGKELGRRAWAPYRFELTGRIPLGRNRLRVEVTNTLSNAVLQPETLAEARQQGWWSRYAEAAEPRMRAALPSGLLGPVELWEGDAPGTPRRLQRAPLRR